MLNWLKALLNRLFGGQPEPIITVEEYAKVRADLGQALTELDETKYNLALKSIAYTQTETKLSAAEADKKEAIDKLTATLEVSVDLVDKRTAERDSLLAEKGDLLARLAERDELLDAQRDALDQARLAIAELQKSEGLTLDRKTSS